MGFSKQEYWSRLPCAFREDLPDPEIEFRSLRSPALAGRFFTTSATCLRRYVVRANWSQAPSHHWWWEHMENILSNNQKHLSLPLFLHVQNKNLHVPQWLLFLSWPLTFSYFFSSLIHGSSKAVIMRFKQYSFSWCIPNIEEWEFLQDNAVPLIVTSV